MFNDIGGIVDDLIIYRINVEKWVLVVNVFNIEKDWNWINKYNIMGVELGDLFDGFLLLVI